MRRALRDYGVRFVRPALIAWLAPMRIERPDDGYRSRAFFESALRPDCRLHQISIGEPSSTKCVDGISK